MTDINYIINTVSKELDIDVPYLLFGKRKREVVMARSIAIHHLKNKTPLTLKRIGAIFGGLNHTTVMYNINLYNDLIDVDKLFKETAQKIEDKL